MAALHCLAPWHTLMVDAGGGFQACCWSDRTLGNLSGYRSLPEVWNSEPLQRMRAEFLAGRGEEYCPPWCYMKETGCWSWERMHHRWPWQTLSPWYPVLSRLQESLGLARSRRQVLNQVRMLREAREGQVRVESLPVEAIVLPGARCNQACVFCCNTCGQTRRRDLSTAMPARIWEMLDEVGDRMCGLFLAGGEPFEHPEVHRLLERCRTGKSLLRVGFTSNGTFDRAALEGVRLYNCSISISAGDRENYRRIQGTDSWDRVWDCVRWLRDRMEERQNRGKEYFLVFVVIASNFDQIPRIVELSGEVGVPVRFLPAYLPDDHPENPLRPPALLQKYPVVMTRARQAARFVATTESLGRLERYLREGVLRRFF